MFDCYGKFSLEDPKLQDKLSGYKGGSTGMSGILDPETGDFILGKGELTPADAPRHFGHPIKGQLIHFYMSHAVKDCLYDEGERYVELSKFSNPKLNAGQQKNLESACWKISQAVNGYSSWDNVKWTKGLDFSADSDSEKKTQYGPLFKEAPETQGKPVATQKTSSSDGYFEDHPDAFWDSFSAH
jgi:hypothetical protein